MNRARNIKPLDLDTIEFLNNYKKAEGCENKHYEPKEKIDEDLVFAEMCINSLGDSIISGLFKNIHNELDNLERVFNMGGDTTDLVRDVIFERLKKIIYGNKC